MLTLGYSPIVCPAKETKGDGMNLFGRIAGSLVLVFLLGLMSQSAQASSIRLYWINGFGSWFGYARVEIDGRKAGGIKSGGQLKIDVEPGKHLVRVYVPLSFDSDKVEVVGPAGGDQFLKVRRDFDTFLYSPTGPLPMFTFRIEPVASAFALGEINAKKLKTPVQAVPGPAPKKTEKTKKKGWTPGSNR